jgi:hypothetical protein
MRVCMHDERSCQRGGDWQAEAKIRTDATEQLDVSIANPLVQPDGQIPPYTPSLTMAIR